MNQAPVCRCGNAMTSEPSTITTIDGDTTNIKNGNIYICRPCIEKSDKEWLETIGKEMQEMSVESIILKLFENLDENGLINYYKRANSLDKKFIIETLDSKIALGENTTFLIMLKTKLNKIVESDLNTELSKTCKIFLTAKFDYKNIWFRDYVQTTGGETYKKYEIGFVYNDDREALLQFRVLNNVSQLNLTIGQNVNLKYLFFENTENIDIFV